MSEVRIHEYNHDEEFYARFIQIQSENHSVLIFDYGEGVRELAEQVAALMGDTRVWYEYQEDFDDAGESE